MKLRRLLPVTVAVALAAVGQPTAAPPRAVRVGLQLVLVIPHERIDPGDRRPH